MHYILTSKIEDERNDAILDGESDYLIRIDTFFNEGVPLPSDDIDTPISFTLDEYTLRGNMTDHLNVNSIPGPVVSMHTKTLLEKSGIKNIEYYQLTLIDEFPNGKKKVEEKKAIKYNDYFIANVIGLVDCVDHEKSVLEYFYPPELRNLEKEYKDENDQVNNPFAGENPNDIDFITKLVFDETKITPPLKVFRLKDQSNLLVFHESIVDIIKKEKLSGFVFVPIEKYTDAIPDEDIYKEIENSVEEKQKQVISHPKPTAEPVQSTDKEKIAQKKKGRFDSLLD